MDGLFVLTIIPKSEAGDGHIAESRRCLVTIRQYPAPPTFKDAVAEIRRRQAERASEMTFRTRLR